MKSVKTESELFVIPDEHERYILYNPLNRAVGIVNDHVVLTIKKYLESGITNLTKSETDVIQSLYESKILSYESLNKILPPEDFVFSPNEVTLFLTTRCNLCCTYCYANGGNTRKDISLEACCAAIDLISRNALSAGLDRFIVGFHGGGEPFCVWPLMMSCVSYAKETAKKTGLSVEIYSATNGILSEKQCQYIAEHFNSLNISADGPPFIQNSQRPLKTGAPSSDKLLETIQYFERVHFPYNIRTTVTQNSSQYLPDIVRYFSENCPSLDQIHVEPSWYCGRCYQTGEQTPQTDQFVQDFIKASELGDQLGLRLYYSGARLDSLSYKFCGAPGEGFSVTPYEAVTSCFEVIDPHDDRVELFHYGQYDKQTKKYIFIESKLARLRSLTVENIDFCGDCFCRWHCAGDCLAKSLTNFTDPEHSGSDRCNINRALTLDQIKRAIKSHNVQHISGVSDEKTSQ